MGETTRAPSSTHDRAIIIRITVLATSTLTAEWLPPPLLFTVTRTFNPDCLYQLAAIKTHGCWHSLMLRSYTCLPDLLRDKTPFLLVQIVAVRLSWLVRSHCSQHIRWHNTLRVGVFRGIHASIGIEIQHSTTRHVTRPSAGHPPLPARRMLANLLFLLFLLNNDLPFSIKTPSTTHSRRDVHMITISVDSGLAPTINQATRTAELARHPTIVQLVGQICGDVRWSVRHLSNFGRSRCTSGGLLLLFKHTVPQQSTVLLPVLHLRITLRPAERHQVLLCHSASPFQDGVRQA